MCSPSPEIKIVHLHKKQITDVQYLSYYIKKKEKEQKEKPEGCQLQYQLITCPLMYSSAFVLFNEHLSD